MKVTAILATTLAAVATAVSAAELSIELDAGQTSVAFTLGATLHTVHGSAEAISGTLTLDTKSGEMAGEVVVDATSADTGNKKRDKKMHAKVLRSSEHPRITLKARRLDGNLTLEGASEVTLSGEIEILGESHKIAIPLHIDIIDGRFTADAEFEVPYVEWGLEDPSTFVLRVAKAVGVSMKAVGDVTVVE